MNKTTLSALTLCSILSNALAKINVYVHKYVLIGVKSPLPITWLILLYEEFLYLYYIVYIERGGPKEASMSFRVYEKL